MEERNIRRPKGPAIIYLYDCLGYISTILSATLLSEFASIPRELEPIQIVHYAFMTVVSLFVSIILFSKKYDKWLLIALGSLSLPNIMGLFLNTTPYSIADMIFSLMITAFAYIMVKMPDTIIREKAAKFRFIIPVYQAVYLVISVTDIFITFRERLLETGSGQISAGANNFSIFLYITTILSGIIPVLCYAWLANWLTEPWEKKKK